MSWEKSSSFLLYLYIRNKTLKHHDHEKGKNHRLLGTENGHRNTHTSHSVSISSNWLDREQDSEGAQQDQLQDQRTRIKMMNQTDIEYGKTLLDKHFQVGRWYRFPTVIPKNHFRYAQIIKKNIRPDVFDDREWVEVKGFTTSDDGLWRFEESAEEIILYAVAEYIIQQCPEIPEEEVKQILYDSYEKSFINLFS